MAVGYHDTDVPGETYRPGRHIDRAAKDLAFEARIRKQYFETQAALKQAKVRHGL